MESDVLVSCVSVCSFISHKIFGWKLDRPLILFTHIGKEILRAEVTPAFASAADV